MARINFVIEDEVYDPDWHEARSAKFEHIDPQPRYSTSTDLGLCSASSRYDITQLADFVQIGPDEPTAGDELLEDTEDLMLLQKMRTQKLHFRPFEEFIKEHDPKI